jgi:DNA polymerase elongation subunit (family B)
MSAVLQAIVDYSTGAITLFERGRAGRVIRRRFNGEFVSYLARRDATADLVRALRSSRNVAGLVEEGEWLRVSWRTKQARDTACDPVDGWFARQTPPIPTYEADVSPLRRWMADHDVEIQRPRRVYLDIETCARVPFAEKEKSRILCWALATEGDATHARPVTHGVLEEDTDEAEAKLLAELWQALDDFDQVLAWNGDGFDFPVIFARTKRHGLPIDTRRWLWLDHLELFRRMNISASESGEEKQSLSLQSVSQSVLREGKLDGVSYADIFTSWCAGGERLAKLLAYNARDVELMCRIESKTGYVELLQTLCEATGVFADSYGINPMGQVESFMFRLGRKRGVHFRTQRREWSDEGGAAFSGAFVMEPTVRGVARDVHVADFSSMYPSIVQSWNMSPDTLKGEDDGDWITRLATSVVSGASPLVKRDAEVVPAGYARAPGTGHLFTQTTRGILAEALDELLALRKHWSAKQASAPPGTAEWVEAGRRSTAYKIAANSFFGVVGAKSSRLHEQAVAESITQTGVWLIRKTIEAAQRDPWKLTVVYGDTDSLFVQGCTPERFREFVAWCNGTLYPDLLREQGAAANTIKLAYEKQFDRIVFASAKRYAGRLAHYKGALATEDSKPEIKGLEYKRGDALRLARRLQAEVIEKLLGGGVDVPAGFGEPARRISRSGDCAESPDEIVALVERYLARVLADPLELADVVLSKRLTKPLREYSSKMKSDGEAASQPPHVRVAHVLAERGAAVTPGTRVEYVVTDGTAKPVAVIPASDWTGDCDRYTLWEAHIWPPTARLLERVFPGVSWGRFERVRPKATRVPSRAAKTTPARFDPAESTSGALFSLADLGSASLKGAGRAPRPKRTK